MRNIKCFLNNSILTVDGDHVLIHVILILYIRTEEQHLRQKKRFKARINSFQ